MNKKTVSPKEGYDMHTHIRHIAMTILMCLFATSVHAAQISVEPVYQEVFQGGNVTINITVYPEENGVYGASYTLRFNNMLLYATSQAKGPFLTQDGASSNIYKDEIDNTIGEIIYAETRSATAGVTDPGVLTTITFQAIGESGVSSLNLSDLDGALLYSLSGSIPTTVNNGSVNVTINETPGFTISGFVEYDNGDPVLDPDVIITNLNTSEVFIAETNASSNHYHVSINSTHINSSDMLRFNVTDSGIVSVFNHMVTRDGIDAGGFVRNLTTPGFTISGFVECDSCNHCRYDCNTTSQITAIGHNATHLITIEIGDILHGNAAGERFKYSDFNTVSG